MKIHMVFVEVRRGNVIMARWLDSQYASSSAAKNRVTDLQRSFTAFHCNSAANGASVSLTEGTIEDVKITEPPK